MTVFFFFNDTATTEIYTLSLHDALPIYLDALDRVGVQEREVERAAAGVRRVVHLDAVDKNKRVVRVRAAQIERGEDRKSTRLNSSHANISYAVFCLKKKKKVNTLSLYLF